MTGALAAGYPFRLPVGLAALREAVRLVLGAEGLTIVGGIAAETRAGYGPRSGGAHPAHSAPQGHRQPTQRRPPDESPRGQAPERSAGSTPSGSGSSHRWPVEPDQDQPGDVWQLVRRVQDGDPGAFGLIYDRYVDLVFRYVYFRVGSRPLAEDLTSETFLRALRRIGGVAWQGRDLGAWLVTIARNLIADHYKSGRYRLEVTTADMLDADPVERGAEGQPEAAVLERLTNATLLDAVKKLNPEQQECITLRFLQGLSVTETAHIMGKNDGAIKALQYRAVRSLGRLLPDGFTP
ncbi:MAG TPA: sigma-70 family RNA polymerase sigma factor [Cryptosporangiaceae bacterium]|nr:sigma-70 family RNA polymerase sigma factor [Cryptosporangiaceae bacterium]